MGEKNGLDITGNKEQLIARVKKAKINVKKEMSKIEAAEVEKEEKAKEKARKRLEKAAAKYADMKAPELRAELEKRDLDTKGKKAALMERLAEAVEKDKDRTAKKHV